MGGLLAGETGAVVGALTGSESPEPATHVRNPESGGIFEKMKPGKETLITTTEGECMLVDAPELPDDMEGLKWEGRKWIEDAWREHIDAFMETLRRRIAASRMQ